MAVNGVNNTTPVQAAALPQDAQSALDQALNNLKNFNSITLGDGKTTVNLTTYFGAGQLSQWRAKYEDNLKEFAAKTPPPTADEIAAFGSNQKDKFECKVTFMREMRFMMFQQMMENMQSLLDDVLNWSPL